MRVCIWSLVPGFSPVQWFSPVQGFEHGSNHAKNMKYSTLFIPSQFHINLNQVAFMGMWMCICISLYYIAWLYVFQWVLMQFNTIKYRTSYFQSKHRYYDMIRFDMSMRYDDMIWYVYIFISIVFVSMRHAFTFFDFRKMVGMIWNDLMENIIRLTVRIFSVK